MFLSPGSSLPLLWSVFGKSTAESPDWGKARSPPPSRREKTRIAACPAALAAGEKAEGQLSSANQATLPRRGDGSSHCEMGRRHISGMLLISPPSLSLSLVLVGEAGVVWMSTEVL